MKRKRLALSILSAVSFAAMAADTGDHSYPIDQNEACMERGSNASAESCMLRGYGPSLQMSQPQSVTPPKSSEERSSGGEATPPSEVPIPKETGQ